MRVLKGVISESWEYYNNIKSQIEKRLKFLPKGSIKKRNLGSGVYYYLQYRENKKVIHRYLGKSRPEALEKEIKNRRALIHQLKEVNQSLKLLSKVNQ